MKTKEPPSAFILNAQMLRRVGREFMPTDPRLDIFFHVKGCNERFGEPSNDPNYKEPPTRA